MPDLQFAVEKLRRAQDGLLRAADSVPSGDWNIPPEVNAWSAAQLVAHLCQVERGVLGYADHVIRKVPRPVPLLNRFHLPLVIVELRLIRRKSPIPLEPELFAVSKETLRATAVTLIPERTLAFLE